MPPSNSDTLGSVGGKLLEVAHAVLTQTLYVSVSVAVEVRTTAVLTLCIANELKEVRLKDTFLALVEKTQTTVVVAAINDGL